MIWRILVFVTVYFIFLISVVRADFMDLKEVSIDYKNFRMINPNARNPLIWPEVPKEGLNLYLDTDVLWGIMYVKAEVESLTTEAQYREIGLTARFGVHLGDWVNLGLYHRSEHVLDEAPLSPMGFPEEDALELKVYLYRR